MKAEQQRRVFSNVIESRLTRLYFSRLTTATHSRVGNYATAIGERNAFTAMLAIVPLGKNNKSAKTEIINRFTAMMSL